MPSRRANPPLIDLQIDGSETVEEARSIIIRYLEAAGKTSWQIARIMGTTVQQIRADKAVPPRRRPE
jgi:hypothetical protein